MPKSTYFEIYISSPLQILLTEKELPKINVVGKIKYTLTWDSHIRYLCHTLQYKYHNMIWNFWSLQNRP